VGVFNQSIDFVAIGEEMAKVSHAWMNGEVEIFDANVSSDGWDPYTNTETASEPTVIWTGRARIQPINSAATPVVGFSEMSVRRVRVQVPLDSEAGFIRKGLSLRVTSPGNDYALDGLVFTINEAINSSYGWLRTLMCEVDLKLGPYVEPEPEPEPEPEGGE
jgi:hypothetical protein